MGEVNKPTVEDLLSGTTSVAGGCGFCTAPEVEAAIGDYLDLADTPAFRSAQPRGLTVMRLLGALRSRFPDLTLGDVTLNRHLLHCRSGRREQWQRVKFR